MKTINLLWMLAIIATSCTTVSSGHKGVEVSWGGETNIDYIYPEGMNSGIHWVWDEMIEYDVREHTLVDTFKFNDKNDMKVTVAIAVDYNLMPDKVNLIHTKINDIGMKIQTSLSAAAKVVVPHYSATELNKHKRDTAEVMLTEILSKEMPEFFVEFKRIRITDVDIPDGISQLAEETAVQLGRNELAQKKEAEQIALAKATVAKAEGEYKAAEFDARRKDILSQPKMLELLRVENERIIAEGYQKHGRSIYGENNYFVIDKPIQIKQQ
jgi:regulator of protease activity HflC (stomatin/prohibitin superfamily)